MIDLPMYENGWEITPRVNEEYWNVFRISEEHVVKLPFGSDELDYYSHYFGEKLKKLFNEALIQKQAYDFGLSVPKVEGMFNVSINPGDNLPKLTLPGLVMEFIDGKTFCDLLLDETEFVNLEDKLLAKQKLDEELRTARMLGFIPSDAYNLLNAIWDSDTKDVYLLDFEYWKVKK